MDKMKMALDSFVECLVYMAIALFTAFAADYMQDFMDWWICLLGCIIVCILMSVMNYCGKVFGYGFVDDEKEDDDEE